MSTLGDTENKESEAENAPAEESEDSNTVSVRSLLLTRLRAGDTATLTSFLHANGVQVERNVPEKPEEQTENETDKAPELAQQVQQQSESKSL